MRIRNPLTVAAVTAILTVIKSGGRFSMDYLRYFFYVVIPMSLIIFVILFTYNAISQLPQKYFIDMTCKELIEEYKSGSYTSQVESKIISIMILKKCELK